MGYLVGKNILVTGGGGGIGWGICLECAREGARVIVTDVDDEKGVEVLSQCLLISKGHVYKHLDLLQISEFPEILKETYNEVGGVDVLVNNSGINTPNDILNMTEESWDNVMGVNVRGHVFLTKLVVQKMIDSKEKGSVVFISSVHQDVPQRPHYTASKSAIRGLVKSMAVEFAPYGIKVNGIAPGGIYIDKRVEEPEKAGKEPTVLLGRKNGIPSDIGRMVVVLASDYWSRHITGEMVTVSGGQYMKPVVLGV